MITPPSAVVGQGATRTLTATALDANGATLNGKTITWSSSSPTTVSVNASTGVATGMALGSATITATSEGKTATTAVLVMPPVSTVTLAATTSSMIAHSEQPVSATLKDAAGSTLSGRALAWSSSNTSVATVDGFGSVTAVAAGSATISAVSEGKTGTLAITVTGDDILPGSIVGGIWHSCALTATGKAYCWGIEPGTGTGQGNLTRTVKPVVGDLTFKMLAAAGQRTIGLTTAGEVYAWGQDFNGSLGIGTTGNQYTPAKVNVPGIVKAIAVSSVHTLALTTTGAVYAWGDNAGGQIGEQGSSARSTPFLVAGLPADIQKIAAAYYASFAITSTGVAYAWGESGLTGDGTMNRRYSPVLVAGNIKFAEIVSGGNAASSGSIFGFATDGKVYGWGGSTYPSPALIGGGQTFKQLTISGGYTHGLTAAGDVYAFGIDAVLVNGAMQRAPTLVPGGRKFVAIGGAAGTTLGFTADGSIFAWGVGDANQRGDGVSSGEVATTPVGQAPPGFALTPVSSAAPSIPQGSSKTITIPISGTDGGFSRSGVLKFKGTVTLSTGQASPGVSATIVPQTWTPGSGTEITVTISVSSSTPTGNAGIQIVGTSPDAATQTVSYGINVTAPLPAGNPGNYTCTSESSSVASGYQCVTYNGKTTLVKYAIPELVGTWVDRSAGVCFNWGSDGQATVRYQGGGLLGGATRTTPSGKWGAMATSTGGYYPNLTQWYIYTAQADDQTKLLGYDSSSKQIVGWSFSKGSCPW